MKLSRHWLWLLFIPLIGVGLSQLRLGTDVLDLLPPDEPAVQGLKLYQQHFANARELIITVRCTNAEQAESAAMALSKRLRHETNLIAAVAWQPPWMETSTQIGELLAFMRLNQAPEVFGELTNRLAPGNLEKVLAGTREVLSTSLSPMDIARRAFDPYDLVSLPSTNSMSGFSMENAQSMFASKDGCFRLLYVESSVDLIGYRECSEWLGAVRETVDGVVNEHRDWEGIKIGYTGRPPFVAEIAGSMKKDISGSVTGTAFIIALLFWLAHRRWLPMLWLLALLALILIATLALGSLLLGSVSVVSMGFAAILLGLAVDYALVHYQEALAHPNATVRQIRRAIAPSIVWAAVTTISAFLVLNLGGLPGLAQLGTLVAIGVALSALVMVLAYLPPLFRDRLTDENAGVATEAQAGPPGLSARPGRRRGWAGVVTAMILITTGAILSFHAPGMDRTANALKPLHSPAQSALDEIEAEMGMPQDPLWIIVSGQTEQDVYDRLGTAERFLNEARARKAIDNYLLPAMLWPRPDCQMSNRVAAGIVAGLGPALRETALREGFTGDSLLLTDEMLRVFSRVSHGSGVMWPTNGTSQWLMKRFVAHSTNEWFVLGLVYPSTSHEAETGAALLAQPPDPGLRLSGWQLLGATTLERVQKNLWRVVTPMVLLVLLSLAFAFRRWNEVLLGIGVLFLSGLCLLAIMALAGWSWNLLNLMALPLMLGTGVDYSIFMQLALRRNGGDLELTRRSVGRALLLCGATAMAGFGSLAWSSNAGMASLGKVCAVGVGTNMLVSVYLLPAWWHAVAARRPSQP